MQLHQICLARQDLTTSSMPERKGETDNDDHAASQHGRRWLNAGSGPDPDWAENGFEKHQQAHVRWVRVAR